VWRPEKRKSQGFVLVELNRIYSSHIAYAYLANVLARQLSSKIATFSASKSSTGPLPVWAYWIPRIFWFFFSDHGKTYRSFGSKKVFFPVTTRSQRNEAKNLVKEFFKINPTKRDFEKFRVSGILIGDLVYDSYLRNRNTPTIDLASKDLKRFLEESTATALYWIVRFQSGQVKAVIVSHCVYTLAIPLRVGLDKKVPCFQATATTIYRLSKDRPFAYDEFKNFPQTFAALSATEQQTGLRDARLLMNRRFGGEVGVNMTYSTASSFGQTRPYSLLANTSKTKVLVATHCFFDSPHLYGTNLFPDFWEWLDFLGDLSESVDYEWYLKVHPDFKPGTLEIIDILLQRHSKFLLVPPDSSHHQLIREGVTAALTVYGTIGFEYAALGIPVVNASTVNPHIAYSFNHHPATVEEYEKMIRSIPDLSRPEKIQSVEEYYFMKHLYGGENLFFEDFGGHLRNRGGAKLHTDPLVLGIFVSEWSQNQHAQLIDTVHSWVLSGERKLESPGRKGS
jgi:hypothetical protein